MPNSYASASYDSKIVLFLHVLFDAFAFIFSMSFYDLVEELQILISYLLPRIDS